MKKKYIEYNRHWGNTTNNHFAPLTTKIPKNIGLISGFREKLGIINFIEPSFLYRTLYIYTLLCQSGGHLHIINTNKVLSKFLLNLFKQENKKGKGKLPFSRKKRTSFFPPFRPSIYRIGGKPFYRLDDKKKREFLIFSKMTERYILSKKKYILYPYKYPSQISLFTFLTRTLFKSKSYRFALQCFLLKTRKEGDGSIYLFQFFKHFFSFFPIEKKIKKKGRNEIKRQYKEIYRKFEYYFPTEPKYGRTYYIRGLFGKMNRLPPFSPYIIRKVKRGKREITLYRLPPFPPSSKKKCVISIAHSKWIGGYLTNWMITARSIRAHYFIKDRFSKTLKKKNIHFSIFRKLRKLFDGFLTKKKIKKKIKTIYTKKKPDCICIFNPYENRDYDREAKKGYLSSLYPVFACINTTTNNSFIQYPFFGNSFSVTNLTYICHSFIRSFLYTEKEQLFQKYKK